MKVKELIKALKGREENEIWVACDEEWNTIFTDFRIGEYSKNKLVIFGLSTTELEEED